MGWTSHDSEAARQWLDELQGRVMLVDVVSPLEPDLADAAWSGDADQPLNAPRLAEPNCLEWLLNLPPDHEGRSKAAIDAELQQERDWSLPGLWRDRSQDALEMEESLRQEWSQR